MKRLMLFSIAILYVILVQGQAGELDPGFAKRGWTFVDMPKGNYYYERVHDVLLQNNNKYIVLFETEANAILTRYYADGSRDMGFGFNGYSLPVRVKPSRAAQQSDGKIVVVGNQYNINTSNYEIILIRYRPNGTLDTTFGKKGLVFTTFNTFDQTLALAIQSDEKIIITGSVANNNDGFSNFFLARFGQDGTLDTTFGDQGKVITDIGDRNDDPNAIAIQKDRKIVVLGTSDIRGSAADFAVARYNEDGSLDKSFKGDGKFNIDFGDTYDAANALAIQEDGKIIMAGVTSAYNSGTYDEFAMIRYDDKGNLDKHFGVEGKVITDFDSSNEYINTLAIFPDGKILAAGVYAKIFEVDFAIVRYQTNGSIDKSFGDEGKVITDMGREAEVASMILQNNSKILVAGNANYFSYSNYDIALARYETDGSLDNSFSENGKLHDFYDAGASIVNDIAVQNDGKILTGGYTFKIYDEDFEHSLFALARYEPDGSLDSSFGVNGIVNTQFGVNGHINSMVIQKDGKIVAAGTSGGFDEDHVDFALARYNLDGSLDTTFGDHGKVTTDFGGNDYGNSVVIQNDGKIIVAGYSFDYTNTNIVLARYKPDGSLDHSFDGDGMLTTDLGGFDYGIDLVIQSNGKIVVAGRTTKDFFDNSDIVLLRYNPDGKLDNSFGENGKVVTDIGVNDFASALALQTDQKIVVAGYVYDAGLENADFVLLRYLPNGKPDHSFSENGNVTANFRARDEAKSLVIQEDGKLIIAGGVGNADKFGYDIAIARYNSDGSPDYSFSENGTLTRDFGSDETANALYIYNGLLYVGGESVRGILAAYQLGDIEQQKNQHRNVYTSGAIMQKASLSASPNPSNSYFTITLQSPVKSTVTLTVVDEAGRVVETRRGEFSNSSIQIGHQYRKGVYYVKVVQGNNSSVIKLLKNSD